jgi:hypothetical protein
MFDIVFIIFFIILIFLLILLLIGQSYPILMKEKGNIEDCMYFTKNGDCLLRGYTVYENGKKQTLFLGCEYIDEKNICSKFKR